ncbi:ABC transporter permease [Chitinophaga silvatica]|uniref:ABC transporter permease n=1 Tax=Chitinophaga silvatica TaxID=2282649 RepID=A0A3E1YAM1_9BACT|nr:ABC transporter permease [Chitinophaga silvatica]RFS22686.1 ABC transporter permease [Chitinophaga silvatica]
MLSNYLKIAIRNLSRNKLFSVLNIIGLSTGIACSALIYLWVTDEINFDKFHKNTDRIFRITAQINEVKAALVPIPLAMAVKASEPDVDLATRVVSLEAMVTVGAKKYEDKHILYADSNFLKVFTFPMLAGEQINLTKPGEVLLTEAGARKYFGDPQYAIGKMLHVDNDYSGNDLMVAGILTNVPSNSHLQFDMLLPIQLYEKTMNQAQAWGNYDVFTYLLLNGHFNRSAKELSALEKRIMSIHKKEDITNTKATLSLQSLSDIHLHPGLMLDVEGIGNREHVNIFSLVAIFILLIACINFMNLSTALSGGRAKEVGLRKAIGAERYQLIFQFLTETMILVLVALLIGLFLAFVLLPVFNQLTGKSISMHLITFRFLCTLVIGAIGIGILAGSYPAFALSSFLPVKVLKGAKAMSNKGSLFRSSLIVTQFSIAIILMIGTIVVYRQLSFIQNRDIGYNKNDLVYVPIPKLGNLVQHNQSLRAALSEKLDMDNVTIVSHLPTDLTTGTQSVYWDGKDPQFRPLFSRMWVDYNVMKTFKMTLKSGRFFRKDDIADENNYVVNETALKVLNVDANSAIGKKLTIDNRTGEIVGVLNDFNFKAIQQPIQPLFMHNASSGDFNGNSGYVVVRTPISNVENVKAELQVAFNKTFGDYPFTMGFINQDLEHLYYSEQRMGKLFNIFSVLSILVSCLGLFGLTAYATQQRIREIGIRKVLGASVVSIVGMLSKDLLLLVVIAILVSFPIAGWVMHQWLSNFVFHVSLDWWIYAMAGFIAVFVAFITMSFQSIKAARSNPIQSLKTEG